MSSAFVNVDFATFVLYDATGALAGTATLAGLGAYTAAGFGEYAELFGAFGEEEAPYVLFVDRLAAPPLLPPLPPPAPTTLAPLHRHTVC